MRTYGKLSFDPARQQWVITTTPDVTMRLKRIFPRLEQKVATEMRVSATTEIANDLEWVLVRFPMHMEPHDADRLAKVAAAHRQRQIEIDGIFSAPRSPSSFALALAPREYQALAASLHLAQGFLLLADEVGLGKTVSAIATLTEKRALPALIVVKAHLPRQWEEEIKKFIPGAWVHIIKSRKPYKLPIADIYIISYSKLDSWWGYFAGKIQSAIYDEIQELRIEESKKYQAAQMLNSTVPMKMGLSATPVCNYGGEIWNVVNLLSPDVLGSKEEFIREWCEYMYGKVSVKQPEALGAYLRNQKIMLRRTRKDVGRELPPIMRYVQEVEFDRAVYERGVSAADELARLILTGTFEQRGQAARKFDLEMRQTTGLAKAPYVAELVRMLIDSGEKVLLAGWHRAVYEVWKDRLRDLKPVFFTGHESANQKEQAKRDFIEGRTDLMVISLRSGDGMNGLQDVCSVVVFGEMDWSPAIHHQLVGRLARDGQKASVQVFIPVAPIGSDPTMASVLGLKTAQATGIVDQGVVDNPDIIETDPQRVKQLAIDYLKSRNIEVPQSAPEELTLSD
jgi:SNF2 family DNA or RNA helicase